MRTWYKLRLCQHSWCDRSLLWGRARRIAWGSHGRRASGPGPLRDLHFITFSNHNSMFNVTARSHIAGIESGRPPDQDQPPATCDRLCRNADGVNVLCIRVAEPLPRTPRPLRHISHVRPSQTGGGPAPHHRPRNQNLHVSNNAHARARPQFRGMAAGIA